MTHDGFLTHMVALLSFYDSPAYQLSHGPVPKYAGSSDWQTENILQTLDGLMQRLRKAERGERRTMPGAFSANTTTASSTPSPGRRSPNLSLSLSDIPASDFLPDAAFKEHTTPLNGDARDAASQGHVMGVMGGISDPQSTPSHSRSAPPSSNFEGHQGESYTNIDEFAHKDSRSYADIMATKLCPTCGARIHDSRTLNSLGLEYRSGEGGFYGGVSFGATYHQQSPLAHLLHHPGTGKRKKRSPSMSSPLGVVAQGGPLEKAAVNSGMSAVDELRLLKAQVCLQS